MTTTTYTAEDIKPGCTIVVRPSWRRNARRFKVAEIDILTGRGYFLVIGDEMRANGARRFRAGRTRHEFMVNFRDIIEIIKPNGA